MRREWIEMPGKVWEWLVNTSPSMRREWIEIFDNIVNKIKEIVSLHAEGVD